MKVIVEGHAECDNSRELVIPSRVQKCDLKRPLKALVGLLL